MSKDVAPAEYEQSHVHSVYEEIAQQFSSTRYKPWPIIDKFLKIRPAGSIGADIGCGNGKNLNLNPEVFIVGSDRSESLARIAKSRLRTAEGFAKDEIVVADILDLPYPTRFFDFALCIAVVHHLSSHERRVQAISTVLSVLRRAEAATALFYVWALEQKESRRGWDENSSQDVMVPWVLKAPRNSGTTDKTLERYYHLYRKGELEDNIRQAGGKVVESGYEKDNWWAIARNAT
jgi:tRNA (uracil-5-)-methyltransferase TRM9